MSYDKQTNLFEGRYNISIVYTKGHLLTKVNGKSS